MAYGHAQLWPLLVFLTLAQSALAQTYTAIDCPDAFLTQARGFNDRGDVVGNCDDADKIYGFLFRNGRFKAIQVPTAAETHANCINNWGEVVGRCWDDEDVLHGYRLQHGPFTTIDPPGSLETSTRGIDDLGGSLAIIGAPISLACVPTSIR